MLITSISTFTIAETAPTLRVTDFSFSFHAILSLLVVVGATRVLCCNVKQHHWLVEVHSALSSVVLYYLFFFTFLNLDVARKNYENAFCFSKLTRQNVVAYLIRRWYVIASFLYHVTTITSALSIWTKFPTFLVKWVVSMVRLGNSANLLTLRREITELWTMLMSSDVNDYVIITVIINVIAMLIHI